jgi:sulfite oxidase
LSMNGEHLDAKRGYPVRIVFPGIIGARWVKWVSELVVRADESQNFYMQKDYKQLSPLAHDRASAKPFWSVTEPMMDTPINSVIGIPRSGSVVKRDKEKMITVRGYAIPDGAYGPVAKVEVSADDGQTWTDAELDFGGVDKAGMASVRWSWCLWTARVRVSRGVGRLLSRATDYGGNVQPRESPWNLRGVGYNAWGESKDLEIL